MKKSSKSKKRTILPRFPKRNDCHYQQILESTIQKERKGQLM
jgi:hypothetical protein